MYMYFVLLYLAYHVDLFEFGISFFVTFMPHCGQFVTGVPGEHPSPNPNLLATFSHAPA